MAKKRGPIWIDPTELNLKALKLRKEAPKVFDKMFVAWLLGASGEVNLQSQRNAGHIKGATSNYQRGFRISPVAGSEGKRHILIFNLMNYSMVIEYGGTWGSKGPPIGALDEWVRKVIAPETPEEVRQIAFAIGASFKKKAPEQGVKGRTVMSRALKMKEERIVRLFKNMVNGAIKKLYEEMGKENIK